MLRGNASRSFLIQLAVGRLLYDVETGKLSLSINEREERKITNCFKNSIYNVWTHIRIHTKLINSLQYPWGPILNRLHSGQVSENMALVKGLILQDETKLSPIQRRTLFGIISFIATVYRNSYEFENFDYLLYQYKALRLWQAITSGNDFEVLTDPQSSQHRLLLELPSILSNSRRYWRV